MFHRSIQASGGAPSISSAAGPVPASPVSGRWLQPTFLVGRLQPILIRTVIAAERWDWWRLTPDSHRETA